MNECAGEGAYQIRLDPRTAREFLKEFAGS